MDFRLHARTAVGLTTLAWVLIWVSGCGRTERRPGAPDNPPRHLLLITIDTLRADHLGCYGYERATTPFIDSLATQGTRFARAFAHASLTLPSHASIMTGQLPVTHGARSNWEPIGDQDILTLAEICRERGFQTAAVVGGFVLNSRFGLAQGFDHYDDQFAQATRPAGEVLGRALAWLDQRDPDKPVFLWVHFMDPHAPYLPPEHVLRSDPQIVNAAQALEKIRVATVLEGVEPTPEQVHGLMTLYDTEIFYTDAALGHLVQAFKALDLWDQTLFVLTSDHGEGFDHDYYFDHGDRLYDSQLHVPLILAHGGSIPQGEVVEEVVRSIDLLPTIAGTFGWQMPHEVAGVSLRVFFDGEHLNETPGAERPALAVFSQTYLRRAKAYSQHVKLPPDLRSAGTLSSIRTFEHKLIRTNLNETPETPLFELYLVGDDPGELDNVAEQQGALVGRLNDVLDDMSGLAGPISGVYDPSLTSEEIDKLRSLGYVGP